MVTVLGLRLEEISSIIVLDLNYARIEFLSFFLGTEQESFTFETLHCVVHRSSSNRWKHENCLNSKLTSRLHVFSRLCKCSFIRHGSPSGRVESSNKNFSLTTNYLIVSPVAVVSCLWSGYSVWSDCSGSCGTGVRRRTRRVLQEALNGGSECVGDEEETEDCPLPDCPPPPCQSSEWSDWSSCSSSCGPGARSRTRRGDPTNTAGTVECPEESEEEECLDKTCPGKTYFLFNLNK